VLACRVRVEKDSDGDDTYDVDVHYSYAYAGIQHESRKLTERALSFGGKAGAEAFCQRLLSAKSVRAHVDPEQPDSAVLITGVSPANYLGVVFGLTFAGFAFMALVLTALGNAAPAAQSALESSALGPSGD
jgi:hypothetical protein